MAEIQHPKDHVVDEIPENWTTEQELIAKEAAAVLYRHYPGYSWGCEWSECVGNAMGMLIIRLLDIPTETVYVIAYKDIDRDRMKCVMRAGGLMLEAHGLSVGGARGDEVRGLKKTPAGLIVPAHAAMPDTNPGYDKIKKEFTALHG